MEISFSPIEEVFYNKVKTIIKDIIPQTWIHNKYRVDFYIPRKKLIIELDGHEYHSSPDQREYDAKRDRYLSLNGFHIIRFTGREIKRQLNSCIIDLTKRIESMPDVAKADLSDRDLDNPDPDNYRNPTYFCSYMQKVLNHIFQKYKLSNKMDNDIILKKEGFDLLSIGVSEENSIWIAFEYRMNGDRVVDPEILFHRYFDVDTGRYEIIPLSIIIYPEIYKVCAALDDLGRIQVYSSDEMREIADHAEGMARRIEFFGFLDDAEIYSVSRSEDD